VSVVGAVQGRDEAYNNLVTHSLGALWLRTKKNVPATHPSALVRRLC